MSAQKPKAPIFLDPTGARQRRFRLVAIAIGIVTTLLAGGLVASILIPPPLPGIGAALRSPRSFTSVPRLEWSRSERLRFLARRRLFTAPETREALRGALRPTMLPVLGRAARVSKATGRPLVAGFFVNWDDNSFVSLKQHVTQLDWLVCEWLFLAPTGDSLRVRIDRRVLYLTQHLPVAERPSVHAMLTNYDTARSRFDARQLERLVTSPARRTAVVAQTAAVVRAYGLAGVTVDFEEIPAALHPQVTQFIRELVAALHPLGAVVTQAVSSDIEPAPLRAYAGVVDRLFLMLYDEHSGRDDVGPVASQAWYLERASRLLAVIPREKAILAIGAYGYEWNDAQPNSEGTERTFQDVMRAARSHAATIQFDPVAQNPFVRWTDPDSTDHVIWFLDAVTAYNQMRVSRTLGTAGVALWRLGAEDPSLWRVLGRNGELWNPDSLRTIPSGYDVEFDGSGEILRVESRPTTGRRELSVDRTSGFVTDERVTAYSSPWLIARTGAIPHRVALTFDDGPDVTWTSMILDTLRAYRTPATFFVIGQNVEKNIALTRRIAREGHEVGNHTFRHPNLALTSALVTRLELDATERILEAVLSRRTGFFRPPYFGDAEPTTADELVPVGIASDLGYMTVGLHVDSDDWRKPGADQIVRNVIDGRRRALACLDSLHLKRNEETPLEKGCSGSIVLLHDGGGDRTETVAALGPLIDSLRANGDTLILLSGLAGLTHAEAMPELPSSSRSARYAGLAAFGTLGFIEWALTWMFLLAIVLGVGRLAAIVLLALAQRFGRFRATHATAPDAWQPSVTLVVPAYNEARVINKTIASLLAQDYLGALDIIVVDDGSPDGTSGVASSAFGTHPRVSIVRKSNGGKASALNYGVARAQGDIMVGLDADTVILPDAVRRLVAPLADPRVGAVSGNAKVGNRTNLVTRWQAVEYITSQNLDRRAFSLLNCITVVPGAIGAWRSAVVREAGGFSDDTLAEDQDLTLAIRRRGYKIAFADDAIALTEAPDTFRALANQRFRWSFGTLQCMWKHRDALLRPRYGTLGFIAMPNVWIFQLLFAAVSPLADLLFAWSLVSVWLVRQEHGATYALTNLEQVLSLYAVFVLVDWGAAVIATLLEPGEDRRLTWLILIQRFAYRQIMYWVVVRSFAAAIRGNVVGWGTLERKGTVSLPTYP